MEQDSHATRDSQFVGELTRHQLAIQMYVRSLLPGDAAANDVVQQANTTIWEKRSDFTQGTNFKAWAFSIARFEVLNYRKQQARDRKLCFSNELETVMAEEMIVFSDELEEKQKSLENCLKKLRPVDRDLLLHRYTTGGTLAEYAEIVGRSVNGLKVSLHRLRNALLHCMRRTEAGMEVSS